MKSIILLLSLLSLATIAADNFTIYLVRHAEKQANSPDPTLTVCGVKRAQQLANILAKAQVKAIYSSNYKRTLATAAPLAIQNKLVVNKYDPRDLPTLMTKLIQANENALVVGHSNTTPQLAALLTNKKISTTKNGEQWLKPLNEDDYQMLYQIQFNDNRANLTVLQQPLSCNN